MTAWNPKVIKIEAVKKHPDADLLDVVTVMGDHPVIVRRGEYSVGDLASYLPIDSIVPDIQNFYFLCPKNSEKYEENGEFKTRVLGPKYELGMVPEKYRILKAKKIRGIYSIGMLMPVPENMNLDDSIIESFGLKKWEEEEEDNLPVVKARGANQAPAPKGWTIPYYDLDSVRKYLSLVENEPEVILTEKLHGCNWAGAYDSSTNQLVVKSRNFYKRKNELDLWWQVAIRLDLEEKFAKYPNLVFFGELTGNVKGFRYGSDIQNGQLITNVFFFDIWDKEKLCFLAYDEFVGIIKELGLQTVPLIYRGPWLGKDEMYAKGEIKTLTGDKHMAEGWVLSLPREKFDEKVGRLKLKYVSQQYSLQK